MPKFQMNYLGDWQNLNWSEKLPTKSDWNVNEQCSCISRELISVLHFKFLQIRRWSNQVNSQWFIFRSESNQNKSTCVLHDWICLKSAPVHTFIWSARCHRDRERATIKLTKLLFFSENKLNLVSWSELNRRLTCQAFEGERDEIPLHLVQPMILRSSFARLQ